MIDRGEAFAQDLGRTPPREALGEAATGVTVEPEGDERRDAEIGIGGPDRGTVDHADTDMRTRPNRGAGRPEPTATILDPDATSRTFAAMVCLPRAPPG